jgi:hypothetical protein
MNGQANNHASGGRKKTGKLVLVRKEKDIDLDYLDICLFRRQAD